MNAILRFVGGCIALVGTLFVGMYGMQAYYLLSGRIQPDFETPPIGVVVILLSFGLSLVVAGYALSKCGKETTP